MITARHRIDTLEELHAHLQYAIGLELTTVPAYLCALYSISPGSNSAARETIQSVVLEEMLHMALAANVLNAIGGAPSADPVDGGASPVPVYPARVPYIRGIPNIHLQAFSPVALDEFIAIEHPARRRRRWCGRGKRYASIGGFYEAIEQGLQRLGTPEVFTEARQKRSRCQVSGHDYYGGAGTLIEVTDLKSAKAALREIRTEGEGLPRDALDKTAKDDLAVGIQNPLRLKGLGPYDVNDAGEFVVDDELVVDGDVLPYNWKMYSHYARFMEIRHGQRYFPDQPVREKPRGAILPTDWDAVRPMAIDPSTQRYRGTWAYEPMMACNRTYTALIDMTYAGFNGEQKRLRDAVGLMYELKYQADALFNTPSPLECEPGRTLGPAFEYLTGKTNHSVEPAAG
jgi:Ferritin-like